MSHINARKMLSEKHEFIERSWWYEFRELPNISEKEKAPEFLSSHFTQFGVQTKAWDENRNSEWLVRCYLAARLIMASTVYINSYLHSKTVNLRVPGSFLQYYATLFTMRACILTSPREEWKNGELLSITHSKAVNVSCDILKNFSSNKFAENTKSSISHMKAHRELISYIAPSRGDSDIHLLSDADIISLCATFSELAQLQSEILEHSLNKYCDDKTKFVLKDEYLSQACTAKIEDIDFFDHEDAHRLDYLRRKHPRPTNIQHIISEGHSEDYFGSWFSKEDEEGDTEHVFNPDKNTQIIFDIP